MISIGRVDRLVSTFTNKVQLLMVAMERRINLLASTMHHRDVKAVEVLCDAADHSLVASSSCWLLVAGPSTTNKWLLVCMSTVTTNVSANEHRAFSKQ